MTNIERIRRMNTDELASVLVKITECGFKCECEECPLGNAEYCDFSGFQKWLGEEEKD